jgi:hypothetical protein
MSQNTTIPNNMVLAILSTLFCCLPIGIVAIIQASKVNGFLAQGNFAEAQTASDKAKKFSMIAAIVGIIWIVIWVIVGVVVMVLPQVMR